MADSVNVRIPQPIRDRLKTLSKKEGVSMGAMIRILIERYEAQAVQNKES
jgi:predicted DNA-binding protein